MQNVGESIMIGFGDGDSGAVAVCVDRTVRSGRVGCRHHQ